MSDFREAHRPASRAPAPALAASIAERRRAARHEPKGPIGVSRVTPVLPLGDAQVLNTSAGGVALRTRVAVKVGERLSFRAADNAPPILAEILAVDPEPDGAFRVRCRCLLGGFDY